MFDYLLNWKKNPASVFFFAIPLAALGFLLLGAKAFLMWQATGSIVEFVMLAVALAVLYVALIPAYRIHATIRKMEELNKEQK